MSSLDDLDLEDDFVVVLDTNILDRTGLLMDPLSKSLLHYLVLFDASVVLPEPVHREWREHWIEHCRDKYSSFQKSRAWLATRFPNVPQFDIDIHSAAELSFEQRLTALDEFLSIEPIASQDWRAAGEMVLAKRPPSTPSSQQFKDSLIWTVALRIGKRTQCVLVTSDKGFMDEAKLNLTPSLAQEAESQDATVLIAEDVKTLLNVLKKHTTFDEPVHENLRDIRRAFATELEEFLAYEGYELGIINSFKHTVFEVQDVPGVLTVAIEMTAGVSREDDFDYDNLEVEAAGSLLYAFKSGSAEVALQSVTVTLMTPHGDFPTTLLPRPKPDRPAPPSPRGWAII